MVEAFQDIHWGPANWCFVHLSDWWVRSLLVIAIGLAADLASRRRFPLAAVLAATSYLVATLLADAPRRRRTDRARPSPTRRSIR